MVDFVRKAVPAAPKKSPAPVTETVQIAGLADYARVDAAAKLYTATAERLANAIKAYGQQILIGQGIQFQRRPANLKGVDDKATGSIQLKANGGALSDEAVAKLRAARIPLKTADVVTETFVFNPAYINDSTLLEKIKNALNAIEGIPADLIMFQQQRKTTCDGDATLDAVFRLRSKDGLPDRQRIEALLPLVTCMALKAETTETLDEILDGAEDVLLPPEKQETLK